MQITTDLFTFPFRDARWKSKAAIGALIGMFAVLLFPLAWLLSGYGVRVMRQAIHHDEPRLPEWDDWGGMFIDGLRHFFVFLVYTLPFSLVLCSIISAILILTAGAPLLFMSDETVAGLSFAGMWLGFMVGGIAITIVSILLIPLYFLSMVALTRAIALDRLSAAFEFGEVRKLAKAGFGNFLLAMVMWYVVVFALSFVSNLLIYTVVFCIIYPIVYGLILMYSAVIQGALFGIAYRATMRQMEAAPALPASPADKARAAALPPSVAPAPAPEAAFDMNATPMSAATPVPPAPAPEPAAPAASADPQQRDDFTQIAGIGPTFANRLYAAGILTFAQLAEQSVEHLREVTQARATANPQVWIEEARRRASG